MSLGYLDYCDYFAKKCKECKGSKRVLVKKDENSIGVWNACGCQFIASTKWRYDQIPLPAELKNKTWDDFTGILKEGDDTISLANSFVKGKEEALRYCFDSVDPLAREDREHHLVVHTRTNNVVISGDPRSGKTLLAALILKEVVYASVLTRTELTFKCVKNAQLLEAARWDNNKQVDHEFLDDLAELNFLLIDGLNCPTGHTTPPDLICLDRLFWSRHTAARPTIFVCSSGFKASGEMIINKLGEGLHSALTDNRNIFVELRKEGTGGSGGY